MDYALYVMDRDIGSIQPSEKRAQEEKQVLDDDKQRWQQWLNYIQKETLEFQSKYAFYMK